MNTDGQRRGQEQSQQYEATCPIQPSFPPSPVHSNGIPMYVV